ncbi:hypothetical protein A9Q84_14315 [Halobacteriovorax marinus]|uniref:HTH lysR-type domain-containing protein n=1 Tax=Halobacteriovorax marinus TaxID=97084 RepID=A0A1Y5F4U0_9BACT|nr:hypothetical protein A9Q84_14315 [Halobacteriovorax marinus]
MDFNKLRTFVEVAKTQSISKAAKNLHRTQPAITQQIQLLEDELEFPLLERKHRRIYLTKQGEKLYKIGLEKLQSIDDEISFIKNDLTSLTGEIRIAIRPDIAQHMLPIVFANFKRTHPNVKFTIMHGDAAVVEDLVLNNKADIGILLLIKDKDMFEIYPTEKKNNVLVASKKYIKTTGMPTKLTDLLEMDVIDYTEDSDALCFWIKKANKKLELQFRKKSPHYVCPDGSIARELMLKGLGIAMIPHYMVEDEIKKGSVIQLFKSKNISFTSSFDIICKRHQTKSAAEKALIDTLRRELC